MKSEYFLTSSRIFHSDGVVVQLVLGVLGLEVQGDRRSLRSVVDGFDGVGALAARFPPGGLAFAGLTGEQLDLVGHHERRVETDAELTDQFFGGGRVLGLAQLLTQLGGTRLGQRADQIHDLVARHTDAVVANGQGACFFVHLDLDVQIGGVDVQVLVAQRFKPQLVQRIGGVRDQLPQKGILVGVHRVDHQIQQLACLRLKLQLLDVCSHVLPLIDTI